MTCPHGDPTCPCPDWLACHYEGDDAMTCPSMPSAPPGGHCHVEGCRWDRAQATDAEPFEPCGLARLGVGIERVPVCGFRRFFDWRVTDFIP